MKLIKNALIPEKNKNDLVKRDILFDEKIVDIAFEINEKTADEIIDIKGKMLIPGVIDAHVHFNDPGYNNHEDFLSGTTAAAYGGVTTVIDMPCTSIPPVTNVDNLQKKLSVISKKALVDFALWGGIRSNDYPFDYDNITKLWHAGVVGFKIYTISGMDTYKELSYAQIEEVFTNLDKDILFAFHAEDKTIIDEAIKKISLEELKKVETYIKTRPIEAEFMAVKSILEKNDNNKIHFVHISSKKAAEYILNYNVGNVTFETCPHYLQFTQDDLFELKGRLKTAPVVKYNDDKQFLRKCLKEGTLPFVTTDHAGCDFEREKNFEDFSKVYNGIPGTELLVPYIISEFYQKEKVSINRIVEILAENQAKRYGIFDRKGELKIGKDADFTIIDLKKKMKVDEKKLHSLGKYSPFNGKIFNCTVTDTIVRGNFVLSNNRILEKPGYGRWVKRKN